MYNFLNYTFLRTSSSSLQYRVQNMNLILDHECNNYDNNLIKCFLDLLYKLLIEDHHFLILLMFHLQILLNMIKYIYMQILNWYLYLCLQNILILWGNLKFQFFLKIKILDFSIMLYKTSINPMIINVLD